MKKYAILMLLLLALLVTLLPACTPKPEEPAAPSALEKVHWNIALWGKTRDLTLPIEIFAQDMFQLTDGLWELEIHYGGVLAAPKESLEGIENGLYQASMIVSSHYPSKLSLFSATELPFLAPQTVEQICRWEQAIGNHPAVVAQMAERNAKFIFPAVLPQFNFTSKEPIRKVEDFDGLRIRATKLQASVFEPFGAVALMPDITEVYTAVERGMLDAPLTGWSYNPGAWGWYTLTPYATIGIDAGTIGVGFVANKQAWDALPEEWIKLAEWWAENKATGEYVKAYALGDAKWIPKYIESGMKIETFSPEERAKLLPHARPAWEDWVKRNEGLGLTSARDVLDFAESKTAELMAAAEQK
ncbi:TRAP transporter substrate-binding protein DctP [Chloroflexota bacterium]